MYCFIEKVIRGVVSQYMKRYAKANTKYMKNFNQTQSSNYLLYLDVKTYMVEQCHKILPEKYFSCINIPVHLKETNISDICI